MVVAEIPQANKRYATCVCQAYKEYFLHVQFTGPVSDASFLGAKQLTHYCEPPYEAAFSGIFLHETAFRMYFSLYDSKDTDIFQEHVISLNSNLILARARQQMFNSALLSITWSGNWSAS